MLGRLNGTENSRGDFHEDFFFMKVKILEKLRDPSRFCLFWIFIFLRSLLVRLVRDFFGPEWGCEDETCL